MTDTAHVQPAPYTCKHSCERDQLNDRIEALERALREVISVSDRKTDIYDRARAVLERTNPPAP